MIVTASVLVLVASWATYLTYRRGRPLPWEQSAPTSGAWAFPAADTDAHADDAGAATSAAAAGRREE